MDESDMFFSKSNHLALYQGIGSSQLSITEDQKLRFTRAMRALDLKPHYHLTEMETMLGPSNNDELFWAMCRRPIPGCCKKPGPDKPSAKRRKFEKYLEGKNEGR